MLNTVHHKHFEQLVPGTLEEIWAFFSRPENLGKITPPEMNFKIVTDITGVEMYPGMIIEYRVSPPPGIRMQWVTEITHVEPGRYFVDEQRKGPYAMWHHQHHFEQRGNTVLMTDILDYAVPLGPLGNLVNSIFVEREVENIFRYRVQRVEELFGKAVSV